MKDYINTPGTQFIKVILLLLPFSLVLMGCSQGENVNKDKPPKVERAENSLDLLIEHYWNDDLNMFTNAYPCMDCNDIFHYWWQAHAIDVLVDGYELNGNTEYLDYIETMYSGLLVRNGGDLINEYYDDMEWMALALLRAYEITEHAPYKETIDELWDFIKDSWNDEFGGGIPWRTSQLDYKNAPSNGPFVILGARLYQLTGEEEYLDWAKKA